MVRSLLAAVTILTLAAPARAEAEEKDPAVALLAAAGGAAVGVGLFVGGTETDHDALLVGAGIASVVGPSAGHLYLGSYEHAVVTSLVRAGALAAAITGMAMINAEDEDQLLSAGLFWGGAVTFVGVTGYDIIDAPLAARRANARARALVTPAWIQGAPGVSIAGTF